MTNWNIDEEFYPGPAVAEEVNYVKNPGLWTSIGLHNPSRYPKVGDLFCNSHGQPLGIVLEVDNADQTVRLLTQGMFT